MSYGPSINLENAKKVAAAALAEVRKNNWTMAVAVVDGNGDLVYYEKIDDTPLGSTIVCQEKARSASWEFANSVLERASSIAGVDRASIAQYTPMSESGSLALIYFEGRPDPPAAQVPTARVRYQLSTHQGSSAIELDEDGKLISYEEYFPYGSTAYQAVRSHTETPKRYRYTGKERDEENDLDYHGARYCAPWLGRWTSATRPRRSTSPATKA